MCDNIIWEASSSKAFYRAAAELYEAAQLCVFILGTRFLSLGVLRRVFGVKFTVSVLLTHSKLGTSGSEPLATIPDF